MFSIQNITTKPILWLSTNMTLDSVKMSTKTYISNIGAIIQITDLSLDIIMVFKTWANMSNRGKILLRRTIAPLTMLINIKDSSNFRGRDKI